LATNGWSITSARRVWYSLGSQPFPVALLVSTVCSRPSVSTRSMAALTVASRGAEDKRVTFPPPHRNLHWNYFLALERDLELVSRYVEFHVDNFETYSMELARLLLGAAAEIDVVAKVLCGMLDPSAKRGTIDDYRAALLKHLPDIGTMTVEIPRHGLLLVPWSDWLNGVNPDWWRSHNDVKHERDAYFHKATLRNAIDAMGALLIVIYLHKQQEMSTQGPVPQPKEITGALDPKSSFLFLRADYYWDTVVV
jgi:hypothetical protein